MKDCLKAVKVNNGKTVWEWPDRDSMIRKNFYNLTPYLFENILLFPAAKDLIAIDLNTGKTLWHKEKEFSGESHLAGIGSKAVRTYHDVADGFHKVFLIDVDNGNMKEIERIPMLTEGRNHVRSPFIYSSETEDTICVVSVIEYVPRKITKSYLLFWKLNDTSFHKKIPIYKDNLYGDGVTQQCIADEENSYWVANDEVVCVSVDHQDEIWRSKMSMGMLTSRLIMNGNYLYYACEDENLYALDKKSGSVLWSCKIAGTPGRIFINRDVLFITGGSDGRLYQISKETGELISSEKIAGHDVKKGKYLRRTLFAGQDVLILNDGHSWFGYSIGGLALKGLSYKN